MIEQPALATGRDAGGVVSAPMFHGTEENHVRNCQDGASIEARPALLHAPGGTEIEGVAIFTAGRPRFVIPAGDALRLAHQIADALTP